MPHRKQILLPFTVHQPARVGPWSVHRRLVAALSVSTVGGLRLRDPAWLQLLRLQESAAMRCQRWSAVTVPTAEALLYG